MVLSPSIDACSCDCLAHLSLFYVPPPLPSHTHSHSGWWHWICVTSTREGLQKTPHAPDQTLHWPPPRRWPQPQGLQDVPYQTPVPLQSATEHSKWRAPSLLPRAQPETEDRFCQADWDHSSTDPWWFEGTGQDYDSLLKRAKPHPLLHWQYLLKKIILFFPWLLMFRLVLSSAYWLLLW